MDQAPPMPLPVQLGVDLSSFDESASSSSALQWLTLQLHREAEPRDLYAAGRALYERGRYRGAATLLQLYVDGEGCEAPGLHMLAYAYFMCEDRRKAIEQAKRVVNSGFDADWQLLVEAQIDVDRADGLLPPPPAHIQPPT